MRPDDPYHEGEKQVQRWAGEQLAAQRNSRAINTSIMPGVLKFIAQQPMAVLGSIDAQQNVWASVLFGRPGFMTAPNDRRVEFDLTQAGIDTHDPFWTNIETNDRIGSLVIELESGRADLRFVFDAFRQIKQGAVRQVHRGHPLPGSMRTGAVSSDHARTP